MNIQSCVMEHAARGYPLNNMTVDECLESVAAEIGVTKVVQYMIVPAGNRQWVSDGVRSKFLDPAPSGMPWTTHVDENGHTFVFDATSGMGILLDDFMKDTTETPPSATSAASDSSVGESPAVGAEPPSSASGSFQASCC
jgi:hypothetical protein